MSDRFLVDTNILIYAFLDVSEDYKSKISRDIVYQMSVNQSLYVSNQNLAEYANVSIKKFKGYDNLINDIALISEQSDVIHYNSDTILLASKISKELRIPFFDTLLAQTMLENGINVIYTENTKDFNKIPYIKAINPFE